MPIPAGYHNVEFVYRHGDATRDCTFAIGIKDLGDPADPTAIAPLMVDRWTASGSPGQPSAYSSEWLFLGVVDTYESEDGPIRYEYPVVQAGSSTLAPVPINCAVLVNKVTASGGRRNRGRLFYPPVFPTEGDVSALGVISSTDVSTLQTKFTSFYTSAVADGAQPVLFHQTGAQLPTVITSFKVQSLLATQRRRMRR